MNLFDIQLHQMSTALKKGDLHIPDIGDIVPASLMLHDIVDLRPVRCSYMNNWGCEHLGTSADEINTLGDSYYEKYFVREESLIIFEGMSDYIQGGDFDKQYNFFQRVKLHRHNEYIWFYTVCKIIQVKGEKSLDNKAILLSSPVMDMEKLISR
ncbi:MAG TPA: hypothetical protein PKA53_09700, partial [Sphingobacterium sp.]|nr:hypothetical protein [Sphingobacterium sp.]